MSILNVLGIKKDQVQDDELKIELMKLMAEQNNEKFLSYDRATDTVVLSEIKDGKFHDLEVVKGFVSSEDIATDRIHEADKAVYRRMIQTCLHRPSDFSFEVRYNIPEVGYKWYRMFLLSVGNEAGYVTKFAARMQNIQFEKEAEAAMKSQAERDSLSGVYNHATYERLCSELADKNNTGLLFMMVDY